MIPVLFKEDEQIFTHNGIGALYESLSCDVIEEENGAFTMELEYPVDGEWFSEIKDFRIIQAKPNDIDDPHNFRIYEIEKSIDELTVYVRANTITNDLGNNLITNYIGRDVTPQQAMNGIKSNLIEGTNFDLISDIQTRSNVEWTRINPLNAIVGVRGSLVDIWGGQIKRTNTAIHLYSRRGRDNVVTIRPGKNIEGLNMTVSTAGLVTKILPTFTYRPVDVPKYQMVTNSDGSKEKRRVQTSGSTTLRDDITVLGDVVSSQYVDNYPTNYWSSVDYDDDDTLKNIVDEYIDTRLTHAEESSGIVDMSGFDQELENFVKTELDKRAKQYFTHRNPGVDKPTVRIKVDMLQLSDSPDWEEFKDLERIGLTDTLDVWVEEYDIDVEVRTTSLTYDSIAEHVTNFNAGSDRAPRQSAIEKKYDDLTKATNDYITSFKNGVQNIMRNTADGLNRKFEGYTEPPAELSSEGDIWFKQIGEGKVEIWIHDGVYWQPLMTEDFGKKLEADMLEQQKDIDAAKEAADEAVDRINNEITGKFTDIDQELLDIEAISNSAHENVQQAITDASNAFSAAQTAISGLDDKVDTSVYNATLLDLEADIDSAITAGNTAKETAEGLITQVESIGTVANSAKQDAEDAVSTANTAKETAEGLITQVEDIGSVANSALQDAEDAVSTANAAKTSADNLSTEVSGLKTDVGGFELTVNNYQDQVLQFSADVDGFQSTVASYETEVDEFGTIVSTNTTQVNELRNDIDGFESLLASYDEDLTGFNTTVSSFRNTLEGLESTVASYETEVDEYGNEVATYATELSTLRNTVTGFESTVAEFGTTVTGYQSSLATLTNTVDGFESTVATYETQVDEYGNEVSSYATEVATLENTVSGFNSLVASFEEETEGYSAAVSEFRNTVSGLQSTVASYEVELDEYGNTVDSYATQVATFNNTVDGLESSVTAYEQSVSGYATQLATLTNTVDGFNSTVTSYETQLDEYGVEVSEYATEVSTMRNTVSGFESTVATYGTEVSDLAGEVVGYKNKVSTLNNTVDGFDSTVASYTTEVNEFGNTVSTYATEVSTMHNTVSGFESTVATYGQEVNSLTGEVSTYAEQVSQFENTVEGLNSTVANYATEVDEFGNEVVAYATQVSNFSNTLDGMTSTVSEYETELTGYRGDVTQYENQVSTMQNTVDGFNNTVTQYTTEVNEFGLEVDSYATEVSTLTNTVSGFQSTVSKVEQDYEDVSGTVATHTSEISNLDGQIALKANTTTVNALTGRVSTAESSISANATAIGLKAEQSTLDTLTGTVNTLSGRVDVTAGQISSKVWNTDIQTAVDGIEVGGRNLYRMNSSAKNRENFDVYKGSPSSFYIHHSWSGYSQRMLVDERQEVTISLWAKLKKGSPKGVILHPIQYDTGGTRISAPSIHKNLNGEEWTYLTHTFTTVPNTKSMELHLVITAPRVSGDEVWISGVKIEKGNKATDWTPAPEDTTALINHVETELTQKYGSITASVSSIDGRVATNTLGLDGLTTTVQDVRTDLDGTTTLLNTTKTTVDGHTSSISTLRTDVDGKATTAQFNTLNSTVNGTIQRVGDAEGKITTIETNVTGLQTTVADKASQSEVTQLSTSLTSTITAVEENNTQISQNASNINLRVKKGDVVSQLNIDAERTLISSSKILLNANTVSISGTAWMDGAVITNASIDGAKIADATIGSAKIAGLDVDKISGNTASFIRANFNGISSVLDVDSLGLRINTVSSFDMFLNNSGIQVTTKNGNNMGRLAGYNRVGTTTPTSIGITARNGYDAVIGYQGSATDETGFNPAISVDGTTGKITFSGNNVQRYPGNFFYQTSENLYYGLTIRKWTVAGKNGMAIFMADPYNERRISSGIFLGYDAGTVYVTTGESTWREI